MRRPASMSCRSIELELMDDPALETPRHVDALKGLERINWWSASVATVWKPIKTLAERTREPSLRVLDLATGAGDVPIGLWQCASRSGVRVTVDGCDRSPRAVEYARARARERQADVGFFQLDAVTDPLPAGYDIVTASLFFHHLSDEQVISLLRRMAQAAKRLMVIADLERGLPGLYLAYAATRVLSRSDVVRTDGPRSVRAAYALPEIQALARQAGLQGVSVVRRWPCRFLLTWKRA